MEVTVIPSRKQYSLEQFAFHAATMLSKALAPEKWLRE